MTGQIKLSQKLYDMEITELIAYKDSVRAFKERDMEWKGVGPSRIEELLMRDTELRQIVELILDKAKANRAIKELTK